MIDLCPVGALTSKPFRYSARTWELSRRKSVSPHDSARLEPVVQVKSDRVMRVLPLRERGDQRVLALRPATASPTKALEQRRAPDHADDQAGRRVAVEVDWQTALEYVAERPDADQGASTARTRIGALASPHSTVEELYLLQQAGARPRQRQRRLPPAPVRFLAPTRARGAPWLGMPIARLSTLERVLVVGSFLRKDHPLLAQRVCARRRRRARKVTCLHAVDDDWLMPMAHRAGRARRRLARARSPASPPRSPAAQGVALPRVRGDAQRRRREGRRRVAARRRAQAPCCSATPRRSIRRPRSCCALAQWIAEQHRRDARLPRAKPRNTRRRAARRARCRARAA